MKTKKQKRNFVQLELFPEYALPQGGGVGASNEQPQNVKDNK